MNLSSSNACQMSLANLVGSEADRRGFGNIEINHMTLDSRSVGKGSVFVALQGATSDGIDFVDDAVSNGASAILVEKGREPSLDGCGAAVIGISNVRNRLGELAGRLYGEPSAQLTVIAVTGTNGKTTCAYLVCQALNLVGMPCGLVGTLGTGFPQRLTGTGLTTPDVISLNRYLNNMIGDGAVAACIEASSHGIDQGRLNGVRIAIALFTNLSHDHLDYHGSFESYGRSKAELFARPELNLAVLNAEDGYSSVIRAQTSASKVLTFGGEGDIRLTGHSLSDSGMVLCIATPAGDLEIQTGLIGHINIPNILATVSILFGLDVDLQSVADVMRQVRPAPGRMELFQVAGAPSVVIDYAHTPDALAKALESVRNHSDGRIWCVFGCGGDRDRAKRPLMGKVADRLADCVVLTDDNPRSEPSMAIIGEIRQAISRDVLVMQDRRAAIEYALSRADTGDWVLVAGKGHETSQQIGDVFHPFSDRQVVNDCLEISR